jgi:hypothetical protein
LEIRVIDTDGFILEVDGQIICFTWAEWSRLQEQVDKAQGMIYRGVVWVQ